MSTDVSPRDSKKPATLGHYVGVAAVAVIGAIVAFWILSSIVGIIFFIVKVAVVVGLIGGVIWLVHRFRR